jgi:hypothetical protein
VLVHEKSDCLERRCLRELIVLLLKVWALYFGSSSVRPLNFSLTLCWPFRLSSANLAISIFSSGTAVVLRIVGVRTPGFSHALIPRMDSPDETLLVGDAQ